MSVFDPVARPPARGGAVPTASPGRSGPRRADWSATRERILTAAAELFARAGYRRTSTSELANAAGVAEGTLFRHFPTKAALFEEAVIERLRATVAELVERRSRQPRGLIAEEAAFEFFSEMLRMMRSDSGLLTAALAALTFENDTDEFAGLRTAFSALLEYMDDILRRAAESRGFQLEPELTGRTMLAMTLGFAMGDPLLFGDTTTPDDDRLARHLARFTAYGLRGTR